MHADHCMELDPYSHLPESSQTESPQYSSGTLKTTISLGKNPSIVHSNPFYLMNELQGECELTGSSNLLTYYGLEHSYEKFTGKRVKESLSSFLPNLWTLADESVSVENSTLRSVVEKPPIVGKQLLPLTNIQLAGFRLHPGPLPEEYLRLNEQMTPVRKQKNKSKKHKHKDESAPLDMQIGEYFILYFNNFFFQIINLINLI